VIGAAATYALTRPDESDPGRALGPAPSTSPPDNSLTGPQAIDRFKELDELRITAIEKRDERLLRQIFTDGPAQRRVQRTIRTLRKQRAYADEQLQVLSTGVVSNTASEITVRQVALFDLRFEDPRGRDITRDGGLERQTTDWVLRLQNGVWLMHDGVIVAARPIDE
jgi:hypothetical protein